MSMLRKIQRVGKRATKFQYTAVYQSVVIECLRDKWHPTSVCVSWTRRGRRFITKTRPWQPSPDNKMRGVVIWPDPEAMEIIVTLYKGPKDKSYETKEWEFAVIDVDQAGKRKALATTSINMVRYASSMPYETDLTLRLKPVSRKIKSVILQVTLSSMFLKEGKATDEDMMSIASMMSVSNLSTIGFLEDEEDDEFYWTGGRSVSPPSLPDYILSTDQLLNWARDVTKDTPSVKLSNMTTSWRNGIGFLAIFHYYRPDLVPDFDMLSPTSIKENNRLAFELSRSLGVACPLTPNMMVTTTIPDKLAVTSFVYQLYQYFTRATPSAVAKIDGSSGSAPVSPSDPQSPFDISQIPEMFSGKLSPITTPPPSTDKVLRRYSRHSRDEGNLDLVEPLLNERVSADESAIAQVTIMDQELSISPASEHSSVNPTGDNESSVKEHHHNSVDQTSAVNLSQKQKGSDGEDRVVEYENPCETESSEPLTTETSSSVSVAEQDEESRYPELPLDPNPISRTPTKELSESGQGRKLPSPPIDSETKEQVAKREQRRRQAQEMLRKHKIKLNTSTDQITAKSSHSSDSKYRQQAIHMLSEAFNTPPGTRKSSLPQPEDYLTSDSSASSLSAADDGPAMKRHYSTGSIGIKSPVSKEPPPSILNSENSATQSSSQIGDVSVDSHNGISKTVSDDNTLKQVSSSSLSSQSRADKPSQQTHGGISKESRPKTVSDTEVMKRVCSDQSSHSNTVAGDKSARRTHDGNTEESRPGMVSDTTPIQQMSKTMLTRPSSASSLGSKQRRRQLPAVRPVSAQPSRNLVRLAEQKKRDEERAREKASKAAAQERLLEQQSNQTDAGDEDQVGRDKSKQFTESQDDELESVSEADRPTRQSGATSGQRKSLPSPAWSQQSDDLSQDLLVTQSEYVKSELLGLKEILVGLEEKSGNMELRVREAMDDGDKEKEEKLMQEWFGLLNKKNELIKRQIELNMIEKEEDLEKRQFFINRELRPIMEIPDDRKTEQQKERAAKLLSQLLELIDERDKLERRKMSAEKRLDHERTSFASAQATTADIVHADDGEDPKRPRSQSKDCVIS